MDGWTQEQGREKEKEHGFWAGPLLLYLTGQGQGCHQGKGVLICAHDLGKFDSITSKPAKTS